MSTESKKPLFPDHWGWAHYENGFSGLSRRLAALADAPTPYADLVNRQPFDHISSYEAVKLQSWFDRKVFLGHLPCRKEIALLPPGRAEQLNTILITETARQRLEIRATEKALTFFGERKSRAADFNHPTERLRSANSKYPGLEGLASLPDPVRHFHIHTPSLSRGRKR